LQALITEFGASFRKARESLGVSLDQIAIETRISTRFLLAIENEDFRRLPGGIFNRGFIRTYAERIGLDPEEAVAEYERLAKNTEPDVLVGSTPTPPPSSARGLYAASIVILVLLIAAYYVFNRATSATSVVVNRPPADAATSQTPPPAVVEAPAAEKTESTESAPVSKTAEIASSTVPATAAPTSPAPSVQDPAPAPPRHDQLALEVEILEPTWIKISTDGTPVLNKELPPGTTKRYTAQNSINVVVGNAGGISLKVNDKPVRPLGRSGQVRTLNITTQNLPSIIG
jgi:cytoskeletal protein RodZ